MYTCWYNTTLRPFKLSHCHSFLGKHDGFYANWVLITGANQRRTITTNGKHHCSNNVSNYDQLIEKTVITGHIFSYRVLKRRRRLLANKQRQQWLQLNSFLANSSLQHFQITSPPAWPSTYAAAFWWVFLCGRVCGAGTATGAAVGWKRCHESAACTNEACHPAGQSPARSGSRFTDSQVKYSVQRSIYVVNKRTWLTHASYLSQKVTLLLLHSGLVPHSNLQHVLPEIPAMDMRVHKRLVPLGFQTFLHCFCPSLALITRVKQIYPLNNTMRKLKLNYNCLIHISALIKITYTQIDSAGKI